MGSVTLRSPKKSRRKTKDQRSSPVLKGEWLSPSSHLSNIDLLGNTQRVFKFDTEVANRAVHLCMTKQKLDCA